MMKEFVHQVPATRVVFGVGSLDRVADECAALGMTRVLVIAGGSASSAGDHVSLMLGSSAAGRVRRVVQHVPEQLVTDAVASAKAGAADGLCCVGGGSATGLAKAVAVELDLPIIAVPTTYAGSEATPVYGITGEHKRTSTDSRARPRTVVYDPTLSTGLSRHATASSGFNALAHASAALTGAAYEPMARLQATEAVRLIFRALPAANERPDDLGARGALLWAAWLAGSALAATGAGLHHRLCHVLGGRFRLVHADLHAVLLPHTMAHDPALSLAGLAEALGRDTPDTADAVAATVRSLARDVGAPDSLAAIGLSRADLDRAAQLAASGIGVHDPSWYRTLFDHAYDPVDSTGGVS
jgi:maleylacetate reductase